jgi:hypothetical protein
MNMLLFMNMLSWVDQSGAAATVFGMLWEQVFMLS